MSEADDVKTIADAMRETPYGRDGGPAFPIVCDETRNSAGLFQSGYGGMSLRDYFAAKAITGVIYMVAHGAHDAYSAEACAAEAYKIADAMLRQRVMS